MRDIDFGKKPERTKIQLTKGDEFFEIHIPPYEYYISILFIAPFTFFWDGMLILILSEKNRLFEGTESILIVSFIIIGLLLIYVCLFILFRKTFIRIDRHKISLTKTLFGRKVYRKVAISKREIVNITFFPSYSGRDSDGDFVTRSAALMCETETKSISICAPGGGRLFDATRGVVKTEAEVKWLAYEISEWLDKPLAIFEYRSR
jgi:hypothetical protein